MSIQNQIYNLLFFKVVSPDTAAKEPLINLVLMNNFITFHVWVLTPLKKKLNKNVVDLWLPRVKLQKIRHSDKM